MFVSLTWINYRRALLTGTVKEKNEVGPKWKHLHLHTDHSDLLLGGYLVSVRVLSPILPTPGFTSQILTYSLWSSTPWRLTDRGKESTNGWHGNAREQRTAVLVGLLWCKGLVCHGASRMSSIDSQPLVVSLSPVTGWGGLCQAT